MLTDGYLNQFDLYLKTEKHSSENTRTSYLRDLRQLAQYLSKPLLEATSSDLEQYIQYQKQNGRSSATIARTIASIKCFYGYLVSKKTMEHNPASGLIAERCEQKVPQILTNREVELLLEQPKCVDLKGYRDKAMLELLYSTGIRVSELIALKVSDVDLSQGVIYCGNKDKQRVIPLHPKAHKSLSEYILFIRKQMIRNLNDDILFVNVNGDPMTRQGFWKIIKRYQVRAGIEKNITPHTLRHSFAAHLMKKGTDKHAIKEMMGHSDVSTTNMYTHILESESCTE